jgi:hypothetical protein
MSQFSDQILVSRGWLDDRYFRKIPSHYFIDFHIVTPSCKYEETDRVARMNHLKTFLLTNDDDAFRSEHDSFRGSFIMNSSSPALPD